MTMKQITEKQIFDAADNYVFTENADKWSNNDDTAGDNFGSFKAGANWMQKHLTPEWISVTDRLPEDDEQLVKRPDEDDNFMPLTTKNVLVLNDLGTVINNGRVKMMISEKEWRWSMGLLQSDGSTDIFDGETITHWSYLLPELPKQ